LNSDSRDGSWDSSGLSSCYPTGCYSFRRHHTAKKSQCQLAPPAERELRTGFLQILTKSHVNRPHRLFALVTAFVGRRVDTAANTLHQTQHTGIVNALLAQLNPQFAQLAVQGLLLGRTHRKPGSGLNIGALGFYPFDIAVKFR